MASIFFEYVAMDVKLYKKYKHSTDKTMQPQPVFIIYHLQLQIRRRKSQLYS